MGPVIDQASTDELVQKLWVASDAARGLVELDRLPLLVIRHALHLAMKPSPLSREIDEIWREAEGLGLWAALAPLSKLLLQPPIDALEVFDALMARVQSRMGLKHGQFWLNGDAAKQLIGFVGEADSVRLSFCLSLHPALLLACGDVQQNSRRVSFVSVNRSSIELAEALRALWGVEFEIICGDPLERRAGEFFDVEIALPNFSARVRNPEIISIETQHFLAVSGSETRLTYEAATLADVIIHTKKRAIVYVAQGILFKHVGVEAQAREEIVRGGYLRAVYSIPAGAVFQGAMIKTALVIIDQSSGGAESQRIRMVDLAHDKFSRRGPRGGWQLRTGTSWVSVLASEAPCDPEYAVDVDSDAIAENNYVLTVDRYLCDPGQRAFEEFLSRSDTIEIKDLARPIRPKALLKQEDGEYVALEAAPGDIDETGYLARPRRSARLSESGYKIARSQQLHPGDVLVAIKGAIGAVGLVPDEAPGAGSKEIWTAGQSLMILRLPKDGPITPIGLYAYLSHPSVVEFLRSRSGGATIPGLSAKDLHMLQIPIPSSDELENLEARFEEKQALFREIESIRDKIREIDGLTWPECSIRDDF